MNEGLSKINSWIKKLQDNKQLQEDLEIAFKNCGIVNKLININEPQRVRFIRDSLWGNISLDTEMVSIVDSPFFQRQRLVTKLGLTSLVYPGSTHTLLEHALGCLHLLKNTLQKPINSNRGISNYKNGRHGIPVEIENMFYSHAVLLHDFAQPSFGTFTSSLLLNPANNCFERISFGRSSMSEILSTAKSIISITKPNWMLEETFNLKILTAVLFSNNIFRKFYDNLWCFKEKSLELPFKPSVILAGCILGSSINDNKHLFWDLYHGPFGVKTVDELVRDTRNCGVKSPIDHQRMLYTANVIHIPKSQTSVDNYDVNDPPLLRAYVIDQFDPFVFRELKMSIELIRSRVYSHPWRKAFKNLFHTMLLSAIPSNRTDTFLSGKNGSIDYLKLWSTYEENILDECRSNLDEQTSLIASRLIFRQAPKRCLSLSPIALEIKGNEFMKDDNKTNHKMFQKINLLIFEQIVSYFDNTERAQSFIAEAKRQIHKVIGDIDHPSKGTLAKDIELYVCVNNSYYDHDVTAIGFKSEEKNRYNRSEFFEIDTKSIQNHSVFFYSTTELAEVAYLVLKKMFYKQFKITKNDLDGLSKEKGIGKNEKEILVRAHLSNNHTCTVCDLRSDKIEKYETSLAETSYYDDCPCICELTSEQRAKAEKIYPKFKNFEGEDSYHVSGDSIIAFTEQFPPKYRNEVLQMIDSIKVLSRDSLIEHLKDCIQSLKEKRYDNILLVPLSESSGKHMKAMLGKTSQGIYSCKSMPDALSSAFSKVKDTKFAVLIYDDNLISGTQALDQLKFWHDKEHIVTEENINTSILHEPQLEILKKVDLYFSFHVTWSQGRSNLLNYLKANNFNLTESEPIFFKHEISELSRLNRSDTKLKNYLKKVGQTVYSQKLRKDDEKENRLSDNDIKIKSDSRALGFDNLEGLFVTALNVPTATVTAIWCPGIITLGKTTFSWKPLLIRTNSLKYFTW